MKKLSKILALALSMLFLLSALTACGAKFESPEDAAIAWVEGLNQLGKSGKIDKLFRLVENESDTRIENKLNKKQLEDDVKNLSQKEKAELATFKFIEYEKFLTDGDTEIGFIGVEYKKDGDGDVIEDAFLLTLHNSNGNWYIQNIMAFKQDAEDWSSILNAFNNFEAVQYGK